MSDEMNRGGGGETREDRLRDLLVRERPTPRSVMIERRRTSIRIEATVWNALREIAIRERTSVDEICASISRGSGRELGLSGAVRSFVAAYWRDAAGEGDRDRTDAERREDGGRRIADG